MGRPERADETARPERPVAGRGPRPGPNGGPRPVGAPRAGAAPGQTGGATPTGRRPVAGRGDRTGARAAAGEQPSDRPSYHPRATANRARGGATTTMAVDSRTRGVSDRGRRPMHPAEQDALYDTVDQAALSRIELSDRDDQATTYRRVASDGATQVGPRRPAGSGNHRRPAGPDGLTGPDGTGPRRAAAAAGAKPGRRLGTHGPKWWRARPLWLRRLVVFGSLSSALLVVAGLAILYSMTKVPLPDEIKTGDQTSVIYYAGGQQELARIGTVDRQNVPLSQISKDAQHAVLAAEDHNFYNEPGISYRGIARAMVANVKGGGVQQGGSTITQQYVKNAFLTQDRTFSRKMKEIVMAVKLDQKYSKDQILEFYLNTIYFGRETNGIEAASQAYFGKPASQLTAAEGAVIAGLIRSPNNLDPKKNPDKAKQRWNEVINTMISEGWLKEKPAYPENVLDKKNNSNSSDQGRYIQDQVIRELEAHGISEDQVSTAGLRITTTIDYGRQAAAFNAVNSVIGPVYPKLSNLKTGLVAVDPKTGKVLAWYGGSLYGKSPTTGQEQYLDNVSGAAIPSGSTFKAVTLITALSNGASLKSTYEAPDEVTLKGTTTEGDYVVHNDEGDPNFRYTDLATATAASLNTVYVPLGQSIGVSKVIAMAKDLGVTSPLDNVAGVTLGQDSVHATEMVSVYSTLASGGVRTTPHIVDKVLNNDGHVIYQGQSEAATVLPPNVVNDATYALEQVIASPNGTGKTNAKLADGRQAAGKTGTVQEYRSAWFCGYTAGSNNIAACVNMFRGDAKVDKDGHPLPDQSLAHVAGAITGPGVYGGDWPAKIWKVFMDAALKGQPAEKFDPPVYGGEITNASPSPTPTPDLPTSPTDGQLPGLPGMTYNPLDPLGINRGRGTNSGTSGDGSGNGGGNGGGDGTTETAAPTPSPTPAGGGGIFHVG